MIPYLLTHNELTEAQFDDIVKETKYKAINAHLTGSLIQSDTKLNQTQAQALVTGLVQKWTELGLTERKLNQEDQRIMIETFNAEIKAEYPGMGQAAGAALITGYDNLEVVDVDLKVFSTTPEKEKKEEPLPPVANKRVIKPKWLNRKPGKAKL